jgi:LPXTG-motif cell wall-anchored protein
MKKHTTYYVIGAVLIGVGAYLYGKKRNENKVSVNLNPPEEVKEEGKLPETATPPFVSAYDSIKKLIESLQLGNKQTTNNQTV